MKTIVCGPPHSGKSVVISNLVQLMPSESFQRINANGDGEGSWSNNPNQTDVMSVRVKGSNTPIESVHDGSFHDEEFCDMPCFHGSISGLDRGNNLLGSKVLHGLADTTLSESRVIKMLRHTMVALMFLK